MARAMVCTSVMLGILTLAGVMNGDARNGTMLRQCGRDYLNRLDRCSKLANKDDMILCVADAVQMYNDCKDLAELSPPEAARDPGPPSLCNHCTFVLHPLR